MLIKNSTSVLRGLALLTLIGALIAAVSSIASAQQASEDVRPDTDVELLTKAEADIAELRKGSLQKDLLAWRAAKSLKEILKRDPDSPLRNQVLADLKPVEEYLGERNRQIADFYWQRHSYKAAESRLVQITQEYPSYSKMGEVLFRLGQIARNTDRPEDEARYLGILVCEHPTSDYFAFGIDRLNEMNIGWKGCGKDKP